MYIHMAQVDNLLSYRVERTLDSNGQICTTMFLTASAPPLTYRMPPYFRNDDLSTWALFRNVSSADSTRVSSQFWNCSVTVSRWWSRLLAHRPSVIVSRGWLMLIYFNMTLSGGCVTAERLILNTYRSALLTFTSADCVQSRIRSQNSLWAYWQIYW